MHGRSLRPASHHRGFTLVELMVVITIIVVLLSLMLPSMEAAFEQANRAKCGSNLKAIAFGANDYATQNMGVFFICRGRGVTIAFNALGVARIHEGRGDDAQVDWPKAMASVGLLGAKGPSPNPGARNDHQPTKLWDCPSRTYTSNWDTVYVQQQMVMSYRYFGGVEWWLNPDGRFAAASPVVIQQSKGNWLLASDMTTKVVNIWGNTQDQGAPGRYAAGSPPHRRNGKAPDGQNQAYVDGSVEFVEAERLLFMTEWHASRDYATYSWQADLGGWKPTTTMYLENDPDLP